MTLLSNVASTDPLRLATPIYLAGLVYGVFHFMDNKISKEAHATLREFLENRRYERYLGKPPDAVGLAFEGAFSTHQTSIKCFVRSFILTIAALIISLAFTAIYNRPALLAIYNGYQPFLHHFHDRLAANPKGEKLAQVIPFFYGGQAGLLVAIILWMLWYAIPNYLAVLKTRVVILVLRHTETSVISLLLTALVDFGISTILFLATSVAFQLLVMSLLLTYLGKPLPGGSMTADLPVFFLILAFESAIFVGSGALFVGVGIGNFFWAGMLTSCWLWAYVSAAMLARALISSRRVMAVTVRVLDIQKHPVRSLGIVAASVTFVSAVLFLIVCAILGTA